MAVALKRRLRNPLKIAETKRPKLSNFDDDGLSDQELLASMHEAVGTKSYGGKKSQMVNFDTYFVTFQRPWLRPFPSFIDPDGLIDFSIHPGLETYGMLFAAEATRLWTLTQDREAPYFRDVTTAQAAVDRFLNDFPKPSSWRWLSIKARADLVGAHYMWRSYEHIYEYPACNLVIFHAAHGTVPAYTYFGESLEVRYPLLCIYDNGDRCYGIKSLQVSSGIHLYVFRSSSGVNRSVCSVVPSRATTISLNAPSATAKHTSTTWPIACSFIPHNAPCTDHWYS